MCMTSFLGLFGDSLRSQQLATVHLLGWTFIWDAMSYTSFLKTSSIVLNNFAVSLKPAISEHGFSV